LPPLGSFLEWLRLPSLWAASDHVQDMQDLWRRDELGERPLLRRLPFRRLVGAVVVKLTQNQFLLGALVGLVRQIAASEKGQADKFENGGERWGTDIEAACAEMAAASGLGIFWPALVDPGKTASDLDGWEIRHTTHPDGCLIVRPGDDHGRRYLLVTGGRGRYELRGWILGRDAQRDEWRRDDGAWFVPQQNLRPVEPQLSLDPA
jgi:hypothetical protein